MQILDVVSPVFGATCRILVADGGGCVVVDAGAGVATRVLDVVRRAGLRPAAVLATHGHVDHTWDAAVLAAELDVPVVLHVADAYRLDDPFGTLGVLGGGAPHAVSGPLAQALAAAGMPPQEYLRPERVEPFGTLDPDRDADTVLELGGLRIVARHAPGHTEGSTLYLLGDLDLLGDTNPAGDVGPLGDLDRAAEGEPLVALTGDVLFAGSIGRTDLPGGDGAQMARTLREVVATLPPATRVLPGHGPESDIATELVRNPYLPR